MLRDYKVDDLPKFLELLKSKDLQAELFKIKMEGKYGIEQYSDFIVCDIDQEKVYYKDNKGKVQIVNKESLVHLD